MKIEIKSSWDEITWREYEQIEQILNADIPSDYKTVHLVSILIGKSVEFVESLPVTQFAKLTPYLDFLYTESETHYHKFEYTVNGREYRFVGKIDEITTAQYIDYRTYTQAEVKDVIDLMSVFMIPKGHEYNDGYDMEQVKSDIGDMCWLDIRACAFFIRLWLAAYILTMKSSLVKSMKKTKTDHKRIKELEESLNNTAYYLLSAEYANLPSLHSIQ